MENLIKQLKLCNKKFLVVGDAMLDVYLHGQVSRISPEAPVPVFKYESRENVLGGAANVAVSGSNVILGNAKVLHIAGRLTNILRPNAVLARDGLIAASVLIVELVLVR